MSVQVWEGDGIKPLKAKQQSLGRFIVSFRTRGWRYVASWDFAEGRLVDSIGDKVQAKRFTMEQAIKVQTIIKELGFASNMEVV